MKENIKYGGLSQVELEVDEFDLGEGILLRKTFAHLFSPFMIAFSPPTKYGHHGGPWKAAKGGVSFDIKVEIKVPKVEKINNQFNQEDLIWIISCLIRISSHPFLMVPAISDISFNEIPNSETEPFINPNETRSRIFVPGKDSKPILTKNDLIWLREHWTKVVELLISKPNFNSALRAFDSATVKGNTSSSLLSLWGAIEQLFSPTPGELKFRVSSYLAAYLTEPGEERLKLYKELLKLYNDRSVAAHTSNDIDHAPLIQTYVHLRNALMRIIQEGTVPTQKSLEKSIFYIENERPTNKT